ncbi:tetrapyrrole biosynthesis, uroporphyrinogen III synthase [Hyaloraphidium curvatum]|nr:tetrapyrrole biosynthesis, uroporphyrinogen III synthase [Hyaloraphidium curvatum]
MAPTSGEGRQTVFLFRNPSDPDAPRKRHRDSGGKDGLVDGNAEHPSTPSPASAPQAAIEPDSQPDEYSDAFAATGLRCFSIPVLGHRLCNVDELGLRIRTKQKEYCGVIATSKRAVEAWKVAWDGSLAALSANSWKEKPFYVVGEATAASVAALGFVPRGQETGVADRLADLILDDHAVDDFRAEKRLLLFLTGDKRRDTLFQRLAGSPVEIAELQVYATCPSESFPSDLATRTAISGPPQWVAFFSPSGVDIALPECRRSAWWQGVRIASIGPTTTARLKESEADVAAEARRPNAGDLARAISQLCMSAANR